MFAAVWAALMHSAVAFVWYGGVVSIDWHPFSIALQENSHYFVDSINELIEKNQQHFAIGMHYYCLDGYPSIRLCLLCVVHDQHQPHNHNSLYYSIDRLIVDLIDAFDSIETTKIASIDLIAVELPYFGINNFQTFSYKFK